MFKRDLNRGNLNRIQILDGPLQLRGRRCFKNYHEDSVIDPSGPITLP
jgi:hypothetical protein